MPKFPADPLMVTLKQRVYFREFLWFEPVIRAPTPHVRVCLGSETVEVPLPRAQQILDTYLTKPLASLRPTFKLLSCVKTSPTTLEVVVDKHVVASAKMTPKLKQVLDTRPFDELVDSIFFPPSQSNEPR